MAANMALSDVAEPAAIASARTWRASLMVARLLKKDKYPRSNLNLTFRQDWNRQANGYGRVFLIPHLPASQNQGNVADPSAGMLLQRQIDVRKSDKQFINYALGFSFSLAYAESVTALESGISKFSQCLTKWPRCNRTWQSWNWRRGRQNGARGRMREMGLVKQKPSRVRRTDKPGRTPREAAGTFCVGAWPEAPIGRGNLMTKVR
jgi:hypothetical protein